ncbi:MAG TPA: thiamine pyrophosphate-dependent enzyme, partial [Chthoniobacterales bacterium]|nr:thiamine pyrophosphate-dependent enzyme [Chthoniobacterales bacterium]
KDISLAPFEGEPSASWGRSLPQGPGARSEIEKAAALINRSHKPVLLLGIQASDPRYADAVRRFLADTGLPYVATFQGPGAWAGADGGRNFLGRVGIFSNQPGDRLLQESDCVITVCYSPIEYDASLWNTGRAGSVVALDVTASDQDRNFLADAEIIGDPAASLDLLRPLLTPQSDPDYRQEAHEARAQLEAVVAGSAERSGFPVHPLRVIHELRQVVTDRTTLALDIGSMYIWMDRYFPADFPRQFLVSNGQQTLGVGLPWAIAANIARPGTPVISLSGDGGFLFSAAELETAKRIGSRFVHIIWDSGTYDMVSFQEAAHYGGRTAGVQLGRIDIVSLAAAFGCKGVQITHPDELAPALREGLASPVPFLINIPIDYSENLGLMQQIHQSVVH